jgi:tRNA A-37 threonylcarbamoyl transferase component Bud32
MDTGGDQTRRKPSTDDQDTADFGTASVEPSGTLLKDRYLLIRQLNEGGFGTVHLARDQQMHGRQVVVKIQINQRIDDPWFERKFSEEVRALSMIDHPGVVVAIDSGRTPDGKPFLVMQYVDGVTLRAVMEPDGMPLERVAEILKQVGHALAAAHEKGIWHRDLKPENLMLQTQPGIGERVRLIDFGIATVADIKDKYQTTTRIAGSMIYMAPEQALGQPSALTDIYAMGLIAYEMVTGRKPFAAENAVQLAVLQKAGVRIKPSDLRPSLPLAAERLILQSLEYAPSRRPRDARSFGDRLHDALMDADATRITAHSAVRPAAWKKRVVAAVVVLAATLGGAVYYRSRSLPVPERAPPPKAAAATPDPSAEQAIELAYWNSVKDSTEPQLYREYLAKYPQGRFASLANAKLQILARKVAPEPPGKSKADTASRDQEVELAFWNSIKDADEPELYRDYLKQYPHGKFESLARTKLDMSAARPHFKRPPGQLNIPFPAIPDLTGIGDPKLAAELSEWNSLRDAKDPQPYRDYLAKYPQGMFAPLARLKIAGFENRRGPRDFSPGDRPGSEDRDAQADHHRPLPPLRPALSLDDYTGPQQGELHWSGTIPKSHLLFIQAGKPSTGILNNDLPRVPVSVQVVEGNARIIEPPLSHNHWDRMAIKNNSDSPLTDLVIRWKVSK